jgi:hypothetical protein
MEYEEAVNRLSNHSNLPNTHYSENESLIFCLYQAEQCKQEPSIEHFVEDVINCLDAVNHELNGSNPSGPGSVERASVLVDRQVSYSISGIISGILLYYRRWKRSNLFSCSIQDSLLDAAIKIAYAWDQVLAGDIADLLEGLDIYLNRRLD